MDNKGHLVKGLVSAFILLWAASTANAQTVAVVSDSIECQIFFHLDKTVVDPGYMDNANRIRVFVDKFRTIQEDTTYRISGIDVIGAASPEGYHAANIQLSQNRASAFIKYLERFLSLSDYVIHVTSLGSDWAGLRRMIVESEIPYKQDVLDIIDSEPTMVKWNGRDTDSRLVQLKTLADGMPYSYMTEFILPYLRESYIKVSCKYEKVIPAPVDEEPVVVAPEPEPEPAVEYVEERLPLYRFCMRTDTEKFDYYKLVFAFRENLLMPLLNIGIEFPLGNRWSVAMDHYYPWLWRYWPTNTNKYCYELQWEELNIKYWLGDGHRSGEANYKNRLLGHAIGLFGVGGYYDFERNYSGYQGELWGGGVSYQYSKPICKGRLHLEFGIGIGFMYSKARAYDVFREGGQLVRHRAADKPVRYFGPLKADITLVFPLYRRYKTYYVRKEVTR